MVESVRRDHLLPPTWSRSVDGDFVCTSLNCAYLFLITRTHYNGWSADNQDKYDIKDADAIVENALFGCASEHERRQKTEEYRAFRTFCCDTILSHKVLTLTEFPQKYITFLRSLDWRLSSSFREVLASLPEENHVVL
jgi:hypothetical protein